MRGEKVGLWGERRGEKESYEGREGERGRGL